MSDPRALLAPILDLHNRIRDGVVEACLRESAARLAKVASDGPGDTIYRIDRVSEALLVEGLAELSRSVPLCLIAEGLPGGTLVLPRGAREEDCAWRVIVDPIDGTRGLMYQKRSAWVLTGVAPNRGAATRLSDIVLAVQTEIPLLKQHLSDQLWAIRGEGAEARRSDRIAGNIEPLTVTPSSAADLAHGFATVVRFFAGARTASARLDDEMSVELHSAAAHGKAVSFEDQYASTGGQLYELMAGHDRFIADLRPLIAGSELCCHPYDICTALIAGELGVVVTDPSGRPLDGPLDVEADIAWVGYANRRLERLIAPVLKQALLRHGLLPASTG